MQVTQPTVSKQIRVLNEQVGLPLLEQLGRKVFLTEAGQELYATCADWLDTWGRFEQTIDNLKGLKRGKLNPGFRRTNTRLGAKPRQTRAAAISGNLACAYAPEGWLGCPEMARTRLGSGIARDLKTCRTGCETSFIRKKRCVGV